MKVLILGSGGREYTIAWKVSQSPMCEELYIAPGNAGTSDFGENIALSYNDFAGIDDFVADRQIDCVIVGPEEPLVLGITDALEAKHPDLLVIGPGKEGAQLEGSKAYAKKFMHRHQIPTASYIEITLDNVQDGIDHIRQSQGKIVLKADGLAAGKGVLILEDKEEAILQLQEMLAGKFGKASNRVVIEEFLDGIEFSVFALTDGKRYTLLPIAKDYKRIGEGDTGLNTGGMGALSPVPFVDQTLYDKVISQIVEPTITGLHTEKIYYRGFVFFGLISVDGEPKVIEYNCRLGDPETEAIIPRLNNDLLSLFHQIQEGSFHGTPLTFDTRTAATIMLVSGGYPEAYQKGIPIHDLPATTSGMIIHAGTTINTEHQLVTNGGRVIAVTSLAHTQKDALQQSYDIANRIDFEGKYYRKDIGFDL